MAIKQLLLLFMIVLKKQTIQLIFNESTRNHNSCATLTNRTTDNTRQQDLLNSVWYPRHQTMVQHHPNI